MTLTEFLLARIAEEKAVAQAGVFGASSPHAKESPLGGACYVYPDAYIRQNPDRVLAECEARKEIVKLHQQDRDRHWCKQGCGMRDGTPDWPCDTLRALAAAYAEHPDYPDYREGWRP